MDKPNKNDLILGHGILTIKARDDVPLNAVNSSFQEIIKKESEFGVKILPLGICGYETFLLFLEQNGYRADLIGHFPSKYILKNSTPIKDSQTYLKRYQDSRHAIGLFNSHITGGVNLPNFYEYLDIHKIDARPIGRISRYDSNKPILTFRSPSLENMIQLYKREKPNIETLAA